MWVARNFNKELVLFKNYPIRHIIDDNEKEWIDPSGSDILGLAENLFPDLKWEDEPIEVSINLCESLMICPKCGKRIWYSSKDIHESHSEDPWSGYYEEWRYIVCPECKENIRI